MRNVWTKADPESSPLVRAALVELGIGDIKRLAAQQDVGVVRLETALLRLDKDFIRKNKPIPKITW